MNRLKKIISHPATIVVTFLLALVLLCMGTVGGARAALTYYSETYASQVEMHDIGVTLLENDVDISNRDYYYQYADGTWNEHTGVLLANMLQDDAGLLTPGKAYPEVIAAKNSGTIDEFVRITVYRYWIDKDGKKVRNINPGTIDLNIINLVGMPGESCWIEDTTAKTLERSVYYYNQVLPSGAKTPALSDTLSISYNLAANVKSFVEGDTIITMYDYNGYKFMLEVTVDAVQDHNAKDAIRSAWGIEASINNKTLSLPFLSGNSTEVTQ